MGESREHMRAFATALGLTMTVVKKLAGLNECVEVFRARQSGRELPE